MDYRNFLITANGCLDMDAYYVVICKTIPRKVSISKSNKFFTAYLRMNPNHLSVINGIEFVTVSEDLITALAQLIDSGHYEAIDYFHLMPKHYGDKDLLTIEDIVWLINTHDNQSILDVGIRNYTEKEIELILQTRVEYVRMYPDEVILKALPTGRCCKYYVLNYHWLGTKVKRCCEIAFNLV